MLPDITLLQKLQSQQRTHAEVVFFDFDGTLFTPDWRILLAPWYNIQVASYLQAHSIPFILITGRRRWPWYAHLELALLGIPLPDAIITGAGTSILYQKIDHTFIEDNLWKKQLKHWDKPAIQEKIISILSSFCQVNFTQADKKSPSPMNKTGLEDNYTTNGKQTYKTTLLPLIPSDPFSIRIYAGKIPVPTLQLLMHTLEKSIPHSRILCTEKLFQKNTSDIFSGEIMVLPENAGKDSVIEYILENIAKEIRETSSQEGHIGELTGKKLYASIFGDASIDIDMLTMKKETKNYRLSQFAINPTPLARKELQNSPQATILTSPAEILNQIVISNPLKATEKSQSHGL